MTGVSIMPTLYRLFLALFLLASPLSAHAAEVMLRCRWNSPGDHRPLDLGFMQDPMLVVPPGENLQLACELAGIPGRITVIKDNHPIQESPVINFTAPDKAGSYYINLQLSSASQTTSREICVLVPFKATARKTADNFDVSVDGENLGRYRRPHRSGNRKVNSNPNAYQPPPWWLRITPTNSRFAVVPGVTAGELVVPSEDTGKPHTDIVPVMYPMWRSIYALRMALEAKGIPGTAVKLISVFRSPQYNRSVGSNAFGRHIYGDAFDFYIDLDGNGKAADLNRDRKLDRRDAYPVVAVIEDLMSEGKIPMGGIGIYNTIGGDHEVTMHIDNRGHRATWGYLTSASGKKSEFAWQSRHFADLDRQEEELAAQRAQKEGRKYSRPHREPLQ